MKDTYLLGYDLGSSSVKASLINAETGECMSSAFFPKKEMDIKSLKSGWAEQDPHVWWDNLKKSTHAVLTESNVNSENIKSIGISYQMHGLVLVDDKQQVIRDAIIWCDSRAISYGENAFHAIGESACLTHLLNSPGNFTLSKLAWVKANEPEIFRKTRYYMLPGDYIAMRMTGKPSTTVTGLSEGITWDFKHNTQAFFLYNHWGFDIGIVPDIVPVFGDQGKLKSDVAKELGLTGGTPITYRAGDQPNNALSLNVLQPGEVAATAGTSGVVYGITSDLKYDPELRVNSFAHVNHSKNEARVGVLLCINGAAILNKWMRNNVAPTDVDYERMNELAMTVPIGSEGVSILPFGNGAERMLKNKESGCSVHGIDFNRTIKAHLIRAAQEGIAFSFKYGMDMMNKLGIETRTIRAGYANLFLSPVFRQTLANVTGATIELYNTDGSIGAARGAGIGLGIYKNTDEAFSSLKKIEQVVPVPEEKKLVMNAYQRWLSYMNKENIITI
ncbi:MAG: FGGY family carbohydrate kinase [Paludibacter sp.]|nr:FGGY family carbohydrate kinase [Paludibacter sp.]